MAIGKPPLEVMCAEITYRLAFFNLTLGNFAQAQIEAQHAVDLAHAAGAPEVEVKTYLIWAAILSRQGNYPAGRVKLEQGLQLARQSNDLRGQGRVMNSLGVMATEQVELEAAREYLSESLRLSVDLGDRRYECSTRANLAMLAGMMGDFSAAHDQYLNVLQTLHEIGDRNGEGNVLGNLGWLMGMLGNYSAAYSYAEMSQHIHHEMEDRLQQTVALINQSSFARLQGNYELATRHAMQALHQVQTVALPHWEAWAFTVLGHAYFELEKVVEAAEAYQAGLEIRHRLEQSDLAMEPLAGLVRIALAEQDLPRAQELTRQILDYLENGGTFEGTDEPLRVYLTCVQALEALHDQQAGKILDLAEKRLKEQTGRIRDEKSRRCYLENIPWHQEILSRAQEKSM